MLYELWKLIRPRKWLMLFGLLLIAVNRGAGIVLPASTKVLIDDVVVSKHVSRLNQIVIAVVAATVIQGITTFCLTQMVSNTAQRLIADMRQKIQKHVGRLPLTYYDSTRTGTILSRIMWDIDGISNLVGTGLIDFLGGLLTALFAVIVLVRISPVMTAVVLAFVLLLTFILSKFFNSIRPMMFARKTIDAEVSGRLVESLGGVRVVKAYHAEEREHGVFSKGVQRILEKILRTLTAISVMNVASATLVGFVGAAIVYVGIRQIMAGTLTLGGYCTYTMFTAFLIAPIQQVVTIGVQITESLAGLERTREVLNEKPEDVDPQRTIVLPDIIGNIEFHNVSFAYDQGKKVLHNISFRSSPGTVTALIGSSGSGKSTMIGLLAAFYKPGSGRIFVDDVDMSCVRLDSYRTKLGIVLQDSFLFDGSIRENVAFSRPTATEEEILRVCRIARVDEFAERCKNGYDTIIGERGIKLSGGQRQRVSIARAILADPRILILDEATSSLDSESEAMIQEGLSFLMRGRTTFVIAHRLSTIRRADQILVLENGEIIERGTHQDLYVRGGRYFQLYTKQNSLEENLFLAPGEGDAAEEIQNIDGRRA